MRRDNLVPENETASTSAFKLKSGDYLHHSDPCYSEEPEVFNPEISLVRESGSVEVGQGNLRPNEAGFSMCKGRVIAERIYLHWVAGFLYNWEIEPRDAGWKIPGHISAAGVCKPNRDVWVNIFGRVETRNQKIKAERPSNKLSKKWV